ncbi:MULTISPECIES: NADH-quinone oxidoreductase subunit A [Legionella]|uniref:NADH-quinone oxidoreductase subunit A n=2 Tax=Legionella TaxID=445 RepID=D3HNZ2_LEGLN|nr:MULTISPECIES: NADH-quinone oxidoreductase subunit A [Legionella]VEE01132.1 NADH dehydrogenase I chain A [Legionella oakridgensis]HBD7398427.1 NADH-quinone oxidoreductase subunit A [Legionella pneumophila]ARB92491.1 NADH-quinone oxidoreductase subunit A [Legionella longbeachae]ARM34329.1 NADH-quinone oxidoreductase subunit A [Legionella longbeachae]EEZ96393.1 NADH-quinone oxidoreductase A subunit [Legionella longbeachae D-4968]
MLSQYFPVLIFIIIGVALGLAMIGAGSLFSKHMPDNAKNAPYECGFGAFENAHIPFDVRFYLVAILFIIFDLETAFFFPWALVLRKIGWFGFAGMMLFLGLLVIGFIYEWKRGALEWE